MLRRTRKPKESCFFLSRVGDVLSVPEPDEARPWYGKALDRLETLSQDNRTVVDYPVEWAGVLLNFSGAESRELRDKGAAITALESVRDILDP